MSMFDNLLNKIANKSKSELPFDVQSAVVAHAGQDVYRASIIVPNVVAHRLKDDLLVANAVADKFNRSLRYLPQSIAATEFAGVYTMLLRGNYPVMTREEASAAKLIEVATNVYKDEDDNVWSVEADGNGVTSFIRQTSDDFSAVLSHAFSRNIMTASEHASVLQSDDYTQGSVIAFYDLATESRVIGIALSETAAYVPETDNIRIVVPGLVMAASDDFADIKLDNGKQTVLDYVRRAYGPNAEFYNQYAALINQYLNV